MKPYPSYKDSGIEWIGKIPEHWNNSKIKYTGKIICGGTPSTNNGEYWNGNIPWLQSGKVQHNSIYLDDVDRYITEKALNNSSTKMVKKDSTLIAITGATCANVGYLTFNSTINQSIIGIENSKDYLSWFIFYYLNSQKNQILSYQSGGAQGGVTKQDMKSVVIPELPIPEQRKIISFLDCKTQLIDELIEKTNQQIELLKDKRITLINHCVTKGLNPDVEMKDSKIERIGKIPKHWSIIALKYIACMKGRIGWRGLKQEEFIEEGPYLITGQDIENDRIDWNKCYHITWERYRESPEIMVKEQDLLFTKDGTIGKTLLIEKLPGPTSLNSHLLLIRSTSNRYISEFLQFSFKSTPFSIYINLKKTGTTFYGVSQNTMENYRGIFPPLNEQKKIVEYLDKQIQKIDKIIKKESQRINLLKEYRKSLISEVITGKIDVRDEVAV